uniref:Uncharacterized protein n=1 Tax=Arundo donax TaxID=35708 RepID=A0A0A8Z3L5_ARUDO
MVQDIEWLANPRNNGSRPRVTTTKLVN